MDRVTVIPCGPAVNESERRAIGRIKADLINHGGNDLWVLLTNLMLSTTHRHQSDEIDIAAIGPSGVRVIEVKHWTASWVRKHDAVVAQEADRVTTKAKKVGTMLRAKMGYFPRVAGVFLVTEATDRVDQLPDYVRGVPFHTLKTWRAVVGVDCSAELTEQQIRTAAKLLEPRSAVALDGELRQLGGYTRLELQTDPAERFHRVYRGTDATRQKRVVLHLYDLSASDVQIPREVVEARARREFAALQRLRRYSWASTIVDSFQDAPGYLEEMKFFTVADPAAPSIAERAEDDSWSLEARVSFARDAVRAVRQLHEAGADGPMVHRNLTPRTVLVRYDNSPILTGFEYARIPTEMTVASAGSNSEWDKSVAPEVRDQGRGAADRRSDVYSLCASLRTLFAGGEDVDRILAGGTEQEPSARAELPELDRKLSKRLGESVPAPPPPPARFWTEDQVVRFAGSDYRIVTRLGSGGVGTTFKVVEIDPVTGGDLGTYVAKVIRDQATGERVLRAHSLVRSHLRHPGLSIIYQVASQWRDNGFAALLTWIEGDSLDGFAGLLRELAEDSQEASDEALVLRWLRAACAALGELHRNGLVHGDVSPRNLILSGADVVLTDYDCVTRIDQPPATPGTVPYCSPSGQEGLPAAPSDDLYALAASIFCVLFAREPFQYQGVRAKERGLNWEDIPREQYPVLAEFLDKATAYERNLRFATAEEVLAALDAPLRDESRSADSAAGDRAAGGQRAGSQGAGSQGAGGKAANPPHDQRPEPGEPPPAPPPDGPSTPPTPLDTSSAERPARRRGFRLHRWLAAVALILSVAGSALALLASGPPAARVLFFGAAGGGLAGETRYLPRRDGRPEQLRLLVDESILGPRSRDHRAALPRSTEVRSLMIAGDTLYLDLSAAALLDDSGSGLQGAERLRALASTLLFNAPWLRRVWLFVDGQTPRFEDGRRVWERPCC